MGLKMGGFPISQWNEEDEEVNPLGIHNCTEV